MYRIFIGRILLTLPGLAATLGVRGPILRPRASGQSHGAEAAGCATESRETRAAGVASALVCRVDLTMAGHQRYIGFKWLLPHDFSLNENSCGKSHLNPIQLPSLECLYTCVCHPENGESGMIDALDDLIGLTTLYMILVGGLEHFFPYIGNSNPN